MALGELLSSGSSIAGLTGARFSFGGFNRWTKSVYLGKV